MTCIEKIDILIDEESGEEGGKEDEHKEPKLEHYDKVLSKFLSILLGLRSLRHLKLEFKEHIFTQKLLQDFLCDLEKSHIITWYLEIGMAESFSSNDRIRSVLKNLDSVGISLSPPDDSRNLQDEHHYYNPDHNYIECKYSSRNVRQLLSQGKKALHLHFCQSLDLRRSSSWFGLNPSSNLSSHSIDLQTILECCLSVRNLYISLDMTDVAWREALEGQEDETLWTENLENVGLNSNAIYDHEENYDFSNDRQYSDNERSERMNAELEKKFLPLLKTLKRKKTGLKFLRLPCCENNYFECDEDSFALHLIDSFPDQLKAFQTLEYLNLTLNSKLDRKSLASLFDSLKYLIKLEVTICPKELYAWDEDLPLDHLSNLRELGITIRTNRKSNFDVYQDRGRSQQGNDSSDDDMKVLRDLEDTEVDSDADSDYNSCDANEFDQNIGEDKTKVEWGSQFANNLFKLTNLQVLKIRDKNARFMSGETLLAILKGCGQLSKLREVVMKLKVVNGVEFMAAFDTEFQHSSEKSVIKQVHDIKEQDIYLRVEKIIQANEGLRRIDINKLKIGNIRQVRYIKE